jgi:hypothetical protein
MSEQHHDQLARGFCDTSSVQTRANNPSCVSYASAEIRRRARSLAGSDTLLHQVRWPVEMIGVAIHVAYNAWRDEVEGAEYFPKL